MQAHSEIPPPAVPQNGDEVTRAQVLERTRELAELSGRSELEVTKADYEDAKQQLTGESDPQKQDLLVVD